MQINLKQNEMLCDLQCEGLFLVQEKGGYKFTTDAVLLANFIDTKPNATLVEFCAGSGVVSILVNAKRKPKTIYAVEIQEKTAKLFEKSLSINGIKNIKVINMSLEDWAEDFREKVDAVFVNPPYFKTGSGRLPQNEDVQISKYEVKTNIDSIINSAKRVLKPGGALFLVHLTEREKEIMLSLKANGFSVTKLVHVFPTLNKPSNVFLAKAELILKEKLEIMPDIIINNPDGSETEQIKRIYNRNGEYN